MRDGLAAERATGAELGRPYRLATLAAVAGQREQAGECLTLVAEAFEVLQRNEEHWWEAELYRLKGELTLQQERQQATGNKQK